MLNAMPYIQYKKEMAARNPHLLNFVRPFLSRGFLSSQARRTILAAISRGFLSSQARPT